MRMSMRGVNNESLRGVVKRKAGYEKLSLFSTTTKHTKYTKILLPFHSGDVHIFVYFVCFVVNNYEKLL